MRFEYAESQEANASSLKGYVTTTRNILTQIFGEPNYGESGDGKITVEWILKFNNKHIATIYDWKQYELGTPALDEVYEWHIGGFSYEVVSMIQEAADKFALGA